MIKPSEFYCAECDAYLGTIVELCPTCDQAVCTKHWDPMNGTCLQCPPRLNHEGVEVADVRTAAAAMITTAMRDIEQREATKRRHLEERLDEKYGEKFAELERRWSVGVAQIAEILKDNEVLT